MLHYFRGYIKIRAVTQSPEKFLNACSCQQIYLWGVISTMDGCIFHVHTRDFRKLKKIIKNTHSHISILDKQGFPFLLHRYHRRKVFAAGAVLCIVLIIFLTCFIWTIEITGNQSCTDEMILKYLASDNIREGIPVWRINCSEIAADIRKKYDNIIWVSASIDGTYLKLKIKEADINDNNIQNKAESEQSMDIVAEEDYMIKNIIVRNGVSLVKAGDFVKKGTILVTGQIPVLNDAKETISYQYCIADADITGEMKINYSDKISYSHEFKHVNKDIFKKEYYIKIKNRIFKLGNIRNTYTSDYLYSIQRNIKDLSYGVRIVKPYSSENIKYNTNEIRHILSDRFHNYCNELEKKGVVILQNDVKIYTWHKEAEATGVILIRKPVGVSRYSELKTIPEKNNIKSGEQIDGNDGTNH